MTTDQAIRSAFAALVAFSINAALAQGFPDRPIRIVVPYLAGGGVDTAARLVGQRLGENLGQPVVVDNRPGAATNIGSDHVAKSRPDGYTLLLANSSQVANVSIYPRMPYDLLKDLAPVTLIGITPIVLVVHPSLPVKSAKETHGSLSANSCQQTANVQRSGWHGVSHGNASDSCTRPERHQETA